MGRSLTCTVPKDTLLDFPLSSLSLLAQVQHSSGSPARRAGAVLLGRLQHQACCPTETPAVLQHLPRGAIDQHRSSHQASALCTAPGNLQCRRARHHRLAGRGAARGQGAGCLHGKGAPATRRAAFDKRSFRSTSSRPPLAARRSGGSAIVDLHGAKRFNHGFCTASQYYRSTLEGRQTSRAVLCAHCAVKL